MLSMLSMVSTIEHIRQYAILCFQDARGSHDWGHTERVYNLCMSLGKVEGADLEILKIAAYLHDVGRPYEDRSKGKVCHAQKGAEIARTLLATYPVEEDRKGHRRPLKSL